MRSWTKMHGEKTIAFLLNKRVCVQGFAEGSHEHKKQYILECKTWPALNVKLVILSTILDQHNNPLVALKVTF